MMLRQLRRLHHDERGMALIVSLMVAFVILMLSSVVVAQSIHSLDASGFDRQRVTSINAAEAGANDFWQYIQTTTLATMSCDDRTAVMNSQPAESTYTAAITFYAADGTSPMSCPLSAANPPSFVKVVSTGRSEGEAARQIETFARLSPIRAGFGSAIMSNGSASFSENFDVYGLSGNDGDVYILDGDLVLQNSTEIRGNVYVPNGSATIQNSGHIYGDLWANGAISMSSTARVDRDLKSNSGAANGSNSASVGRDAYSGSTIGNGLAVAGTKYPGYTLGAVPTQVFPEFVYNASDWAGYTIHTPASCAAAKTLLAALPPGNNVIRIASPATACTLSTSGLTNITVPGHLAIITDWGISMANNTNWNGTAGPIKNLMFLSTWGTCGGSPSKDIVEQNGTNYNNYLNVMFYTPCTIDLANKNGFKGQAFGGSVTIQNQFTMTYTPVLVPGLGGDIIGFAQDVSYVREI